MEHEFKVGDVVRVRLLDKKYQTWGFAKKLNGLMAVVMSAKTDEADRVEILFPEEPLPPGNGRYWLWATELEKVE